MNHRSWLERVRASGVVVLLLVALPSVALHYVLGVEVKTFFIASTAVAFLATANRFRLQRSGNLTPVLSMVALLTVVAWLWSSLPSQLLLGVTLLTLIALGWLTASTWISQESVRVLYRIAIVILIGAWIGFVYYLGGGSPTQCFENPDRRQNCLYLSTFSNSDSLEFWGAIRPCGIFDEPGALSFFVTLVVCLNELCDGPRKRSFILFSLGLVTLSLAHVFCFATYAAVTLRKRIAYLVLAATVLAGPAYDLLGERLGLDTQLGMHFLNRFSIQEGQITGDNRTGQMEEFFSLVDYDISRYGNTAMAKYRRGGTTFTDQSAHPFSIWFGYGFVMWIPYAVTLLVLSVNVFARKKSVQVTAILLILLLLQRPYIYSLYWGFAIWSVVAFMFLKRASATAEAHPLPNTRALRAGSA